MDHANKLRSCLKARIYPLLHHFIPWAGITYNKYNKSELANRVGNDENFKLNR